MTSHVLRWILSSRLQADRFMAEVVPWQADGGVARPALLLCGDLNSDLNEGIPGASPDAHQHSFWIHE